MRKYEYLEVTQSGILGYKEVNGLVHDFTVIVEEVGFPTNPNQFFSTYTRKPRIFLHTLSHSMAAWSRGACKVSLIERLVICIPNVQCFIQLGRLEMLCDIKWNQRRGNSCIHGHSDMQNAGWIMQKYLPDPNLYRLGRKRNVKSDMMCIEKDCFHSIIITTMSYIYM